MTKDVLITVTGQQDYDKAPEEIQEIQVITRGNYYYKNNKHYILYEEVIPEESKTIRNVVKIAEDYVEITKKGAINTQMMFTLGQQNMSPYITEVGMIEIGVLARKIELLEMEGEMILERLYSLEMNHDYVSDSRIVVKLEQVNETK